jgi:hypothetical protein
MTYDRALMEDALRILADVGCSKRDAATILGMPLGSVITRARRAGIRFGAEMRPGPGCDSDAAARGWETRRARSWSWSRPVGSVRHAVCAPS